MGANDREQDRKENKRARGAAARASRRQSTGSVDWREYSWTYIAALVQCIADEGGAVRLGRTRDGGAWNVAIYHNDDYGSEYIRPAEDFGEAVREIAQAYCLDNGEKFNDLVVAWSKSK